MAKKKKTQTKDNRDRYALFFLDAGARARVERLIELMADEMTIRMRLPAHVAVMQAINEAIERREKGHGQSQP